jgi:orotate phosphoribosyltransferase
MSEIYLKRIREIVTINEEHLDSENMIFNILQDSGAIMLDGHFELLAKYHTDKFFRFSCITQFPSLLSKISKEMLKWLRKNEIDKNIDVVLSPASQGMFFAYDIARELNGSNKTITRAVYAPIEKNIGKEEGRPISSLIEGFQIRKGENVLIVNDMTTTGSGLENLIKIVTDNMAEIVGICLFANRGMNEEKIKKIMTNYKFHSIINIEMNYWPKEGCELCKQNKPLIESCKINHMPIYSSENSYELLIERQKKIA